MPRKRTKKQTRLQKMVLDAIRENPRSRKELISDLGIHPVTLSYILRVFKERNLVKTIIDPNLLDLRKRIYMVIEERQGERMMLGSGFKEDAIESMRKAQREREMASIPKLDYWMVGILQECAKTEIKRLSSRWSVGYIKGQLEGRNRYDSFGQIQLILDRLNEIRAHHDNEIGDGLDQGRMGKAK